VISCFKNKQERYTVGRALAHLLRHDAPIILKIDKYGYASIPEVINAMKNQGFEVESNHIIEIVDKDAQRRFEVSGGKIRAKAGHTYAVEPSSLSIIPPEFLYHGTSPQSAKQILKTGIMRKGKAFVHLASTIERAKRVGLRKSDKPIILRIHAQTAHNSGLRFWKSGQVSSDGEIFLSDEIPSRFIVQIDE
jgi:putative RNA 2'-phosphotransferase